MVLSIDTLSLFIFFPAREPRTSAAESAPTSFFNNKTPAASLPVPFLLQRRISHRLQISRVGRVATLPVHTRRHGYRMPDTRPLAGIRVVELAGLAPGLS